MTRRTTTRRGNRPADREATGAQEQAVAQEPAADAAPSAGSAGSAGSTGSTGSTGPGGSAEEAVLAIEGELTIHYAADRRTELLAVVDRGDRIGLDLSEVTELDTAGLQLLLLARREAVQQGKTFEIRAASKAVTEALAIVHLGLALEPLAPAAGGTR